MMVCTFMGWVDAYPTKTEKANEVAWFLLRGIISRFGFPLSIESDNEPTFVAELLQLVCKAVNIKWKLYTAYRPQSSRMVERMNRTIKVTLAKWVQETGTTPDGLVVITQWWVAILLPSLGLAGVWFWSRGPNLGSSVHRHTQRLGPTSISSPNWVFISLPWPYDRIALNQGGPNDTNMAFTSAVGVRTQQSLPHCTETERPGRWPLQSHFTYASWGSL